MARRPPSLERERLAWSAGTLLVGVDEAGRGPLAGPVVAAAVVLPAGCSRLRFRSIHDSKVLTERQRDAAARRIRAHALAVGVGAASVREIDRLNIRVATILAMRRALDRVLPRVAPGTGTRYGHRLLSAGTGRAPAPAGSAGVVTILVDGIALPELGYDHEALVDGDALCLSVAAAGIIAKTVRDRLMVSLDRRYDRYDWRTNRGYATLSHCQALDAHGPTPHHRRSFAPIAQLRLFA